ncbi:low molecular weight phosphatase family protein [Calidifontibacter sp. DB0510]|uniref:Low molecular weight phosphatase family protein n=1 Tax=Metallococcus carri TaxID=1656884 RepID=A0A967E9L8_9MICO|nr:low molecular weight phosphatase family protein [Metallococcus carri]NHN55350.1 low molecular weight phosphatase family protein [Metallococcus carri]NOP36427.1 low molecular weight phosphatase family protein [Calidifontibacter sp. DB2511S]
MPSLLFVCTGNICRSAFAERYAARLAGPSSPWTFVSAGTQALRGAAMDPLMVAELQARGGSADGFVSRQLAPELVQGADLVLGMERHHRTVVLDDFPARLRSVYTLRQFGRGARSTIARGEDLLTEVAALRPPSRSGDDVADPFRRGERAMAQIAEEIAAELDAWVPRLVS